ncbi:hypothetical protein PB2503_12694 [Parvularcula bermudensis HTCC2503]|uniref:Uncharacterized protein n=1 Tax=Parvularcula bermudensis (strain ATCC BAA-594 / HTCC2503 / KCTC 12087) TaxID=314260 RepID=E0TFL6_PARBH|nr:hypothetical protein PB2503_12694 [Parvularcula bermudensis HTCC2503]
MIGWACMERPIFFSFLFLNSSWTQDILTGHSPAAEPDVRGATLSSSLMATARLTDAVLGIGLSLH